MVDRSGASVRGIGKDTRIGAGLSKLSEVGLGIGKAGLLLAVALAPVWAILAAARNGPQGEAAIGVAYAIVFGYVVWVPLTVVLVCVSVWLSLKWAKGAQLLGVPVPYLAALAWFAMVQASVTMIVFKPGPDWQPRTIETLAMWDGSIYDTTAEVALASQLVDRFVVLEAKSSPSKGAVLRSYARKPLAQCDLTDPQARVTSLQLRGHFDLCVAEETGRGGLEDGTILLDRSPEAKPGGEQAVAVAYRLADGTAREVARWQAERSFGAKPTRTYVDLFDFLLDVRGSAAAEAFERDTLSLADVLARAAPWIGGTRTADLPAALVFTSNGNRPGSSLWIRPRDTALHPEPGADLDKTQRAVFSAVAADACRWRLRPGASGYERAEPAPSCKSSFEAWFPAAPAAVD